MYKFKNGRTVGCTDQSGQVLVHTVTALTVALVGFAIAPLTNGVLNSPKVDIHPNKQKRRKFSEEVYELSVETASCDF